MKKNNAKRLKDLVMILIGNIILAFGVGVFLLPSNILSGGVAGVAVLLEPFIPLSKPTIVTITTYSLYFLGVICLGKKFALQTLVSSLLYPILLNFIAGLNIASDVPQLLAALYGGLLDRKSVV